MHNHTLLHRQSSLLFYQAANDKLTKGDSAAVSLTTSTCIQNYCQRGFIYGSLVGLYRRKGTFICKFYW